jgi:hypothetical protein
VFLYNIKKNLGVENQNPILRPVGLGPLPRGLGGDMSKIVERAPRRGSGWSLGLGSKACFLILEKSRKTLGWKTKTPFSLPAKAGWVAERVVVRQVTI